MHDLTAVAFFDQICEWHRYNKQNFKKAYQENSPLNFSITMRDFLLCHVIHNDLIISCLYVKMSTSLCYLCLINQ